MDIKIKKLHPSAKEPTYGTDGAACFDLYSVTDTVVHARDSEVMRTGLAFEIPEGYVMNIYSRSGHGFKSDVRLSNCVGKIDSDYRGEVMVKLANDNNDVALIVKTGDRIAQAEITPVIRAEFKEVEELPDTKRGESGFGSTGN